MRSIRRRLLLSLLAIVLAGVALAGLLIYRQAQAEANELFDYQLKQTAAALPSEPFSSVLGSNSDDEGVVIQIWSRDGVRLYYSHPRSTLAPRAEMGFSTEDTPRGKWRVYGAVVGDNVVQIAQPMSVRDALAAEVAWRTIWPLLVLVPVLGLLVWVIVGRGLLPLSRVTHALDARRPDAIEPLPMARLPVEVQPLVRALNGLLARLAGALDTQKAFVADAAHELRTPLAALKIQLQVLERARDARERSDALGDLGAGVARATRLVEQLLALARAEPGGALGSGAAVDGGAADGAALPESALLPVDLVALLQDCVAALAALALDKGIDLGLERAEPATVNGDADALRVLFTNLIDNAIKYTPPQGRIDVSVWLDAGACCVEIVDTGPGIDPAERERVFDRFYRGGPQIADASGSGLGLAIVRRIAARHQAQVELGSGRAGIGLRVLIRFKPAV